MAADTSSKREIPEPLKKVLEHDKVRTRVNVTMTIFANFRRKKCQFLAKKMPIFGEKFANFGRKKMPIFGEKFAFFS
jgi:hypothetical protein